ncbi:MAG: hypothetical protein U0269_35290, partial [Polyangiales bacterium]
DRGRVGSVGEPDAHTSVGRVGCELPVVVGSLASEAVGRAAKLVPRIEREHLVGYDLRFDR